MSVPLLLQTIALVFFVLGVVPATGRINWISAGLFLWLLSSMVR